MINIRQTSEQFAIHRFIIHLTRQFSRLKKFSREFSKTRVNQGVDEYVYTCVTYFMLMYSHFGILEASRDPKGNEY